MKWFWIALLSIGAVVAYQQLQQPNTPPAAVEHAAITQMAQQAEAKAQQAAVTASRDSVAEFEQKQQE